ncbi:hypothetical protein QBZ16_003670 [Prototheca wickerhamii]|uniref:Uncharacterized protein n=1 Tax=Prototheca wickerhamii TaxID=3111 RepID=A0AAD9ILH8_PROWI|nr:hypothetical protein QBZ16_003670 [Prototheca wickerhamii]
MGAGTGREFGHRVKGISLSKFSPEEVEALTTGGNAAFIASYLATWTPHTFGKPVDRTPGRIKQWIQTVYIDARFKGTPKAPAAPSPGPVANGASRPAGPIGVLPLPSPAPQPAPAPPPAANGGVLERKLSDILGADTPKLMVHGALARSTSVASSSASAPAAGAPAAEAPAGWTAFGDEAAGASTSAPTGRADPERGARGARPASAGEHARPTASSTSPAAVPNPSSSASPASSSPEQGSSRPKPAPRLEVPLDIFYPEFQTIRATGMLPTGQPVPPPGYPVVPGARGAPSPAAAGAPAYNPALAAVYGSAVAPPSTRSPAFAPPVAIPSPSHSSAYSPSSMGSTSAAAAAPTPWYAAPVAAPPAPVAVPQAPVAAPTPAAVGDVFAGLNLGLGAAPLPSAEPKSWSPVPAALPPVAPPPRVPSTADVAAVATATALFGQAPVMYDLGAVAAPRPAQTGNPFA